MAPSYVPSLGHVAISPIFRDVLFVLTVLTMPPLTTVTEVRGVTVNLTSFLRLWRQHNISAKTTGSRA